MKLAKLFCLLLFTFTVGAQAQFTTTQAGGAITITRYTGPGGAVTIPSVINSLPVTAIGSYAFYNLPDLTSLTIPKSITRVDYKAIYYCSSLTNVVVDTLNPAYSSQDGVLFDKSRNTLIQCPSGKTGTYSVPASVTTIGESAFDYCTILNGVTIPNGVTTLGNYAFAECHGLTGLTIPSSVTTIGVGAFYHCNRLTNVVVDTLNPAYSSLDGVLFDKGRNTLIQYPSGKSGSYSVPDSVTTIGNYAFFYSPGLTAVKIPNSVTTIGNYAFSNTGLTAVTIPNSVTTIADSAFSNCPGLTSVTIPDSVITIGNYAFFHCPGLTAVTIPNSVATIGNFAFGDCTGLINVTMGNGLHTIAEGAFQNCTTLSSVTIPVSVTTIGNAAFNLCIKLTSVTIPDSVTNLGSSAFSNCTGLTNVTIGNGLTTIDDFVFSGCTGLTKVYFRGNAPSLGHNLFTFADVATIYYIPGTTGWGPNYSGRPTALWSLPNPLILTSRPGFGFQTNQFGFTISWATNKSVVVDATTNPANLIWTPVSTNVLTGGTSYFTDPQWTNYPSRLYRLRAP